MNPASFNRLRHQAFTLIELLAVIAIIAVLAVLLFPVGKSIMIKSTAAGCLGNLRQIAVAAQSYSNDNNGDALPSEISNVFMFAPLILPYLASNEVLRCPGDKLVDRSGTYNWVKNYVGVSSSYAVNYAPSHGRPADLPPLKVTAFPSRTIYICDNIALQMSEDHSSWHGDKNSYMANVLSVDGHAATIKISEAPGSGIWGPGEADEAKTWFWAIW